MCTCVFFTWQINSAAAAAQSTNLKPPIDRHSKLFQARQLQHSKHVPLVSDAEAARTLVLYELLSIVTLAQYSNTN